MATRSTISIENQDGTVDLIYCHWDGYIEHNGQILFNNYATHQQVESLVKLGYLSELGKTLTECVKGNCDEEHDSYPNYTVWRKTGRKEEYNYIYRNSQWYVNGKKLAPYFS